MSRNGDIDEIYVDVAEDAVEEKLNSSFDTKHIELSTYKNKRLIRYKEEYSSYYTSEAEKDLIATMRKSYKKNYELDEEQIDFIISKYKFTFNWGESIATDSENILITDAMPTVPYVDFREKKEVKWEWMKDKPNLFFDVDDTVKYTTADTFVTTEVEKAVRGLRETEENIYARDLYGMWGTY